MNFRDAGALLLVAAGVVQGFDYKRYDGVHRVEKKAHITELAILPRADGNYVCETGSKLCPASMDGGCCPNDYDCAKESCYATTNRPSTCLGTVGRYACPSEVGGGCCPVGYICGKGDICAAPTDATDTQICPTGKYLCPPAKSGGCCPNGMACGTNQCYSTIAETTVTTDMVITTTREGDVVTVTTEVITVQTAKITTGAPEETSVEDGAEDDAIYKYYPSSVKKTSPRSGDSDEDEEDGGLSHGALGGIIAGAVAFLIIVIVGAYIIIRHLNKVVDAVNRNSKQSSSSSRPPQREFKPTNSEVDELSVDPLMMSPRYKKTPSVGISDNVSSTDMTPSSFAGAYQPVSTAGSRHTSMDTSNTTGYFDNMPTTTAAARFSSQSGSSAMYRISVDSQRAHPHQRQYSNASEVSSDGGEPYNPTVPYNSAMMAAELEAKPVMPELPGNPTGLSSPRMGSMARPPNTHQRMRSGTGELSELGVVAEEIHGYYGPTDRVTGHAREDSGEGRH